MRALIASASLVVAAVACGGGGGAGAPDADVPPSTVDSFWADFSARICACLEACGCRFDVRPYDAAGCAAARAAGCVDSMGVIGADLTSGAAAFDEDAVAACLAATAAMASACALDAVGPAAPLPDACAGIVVATAAVGDACALAGGGLAFCAGGDGVCVPGATCTALPGDGAACLQGLCGGGLVCDGDVCVPPRASGQTCAGPASCADGLVCGPAGRCVAPLTADAACDDVGQCAEGLACDQGHCAALAGLGDGCSSPDVCGAARSCGRAPETRTCTDPDPAGQPCADGTCAAGLTCAYATHTCVALPADGEPCLDGFACADGLTCVDGTGLCAPLPGVGEPCAVGSRFCAAGLGCRQSDGTCQPPAGLGEDCLINPPDYLGADGLGCEFGATASTCVPVTGAGATCTNDRTCADGTYCEWSTLECTPRLADGSPCNDGNECLPASECEVLAGGPACAPVPGRDEPCERACTDGLACKGPGGQCVPALCTIPG